MAINNNNSGTPVGCAAWIGRLLMTLIAGKDLHVRLVIARAASQAHPRRRPGNGLELNAHWHARHDLAAKTRAE